MEICQVYISIKGKKLNLSTFSSTTTSNRVEREKVCNPHVIYYRFYPGTMGFVKYILNGPEPGFLT